MNIIPCIPSNCIVLRFCLQMKCFLSIRLLVTNDVVVVVFSTHYCFLIKFILFTFDIQCILLDYYSNSQQITCHKAHTILFGYFSLASFFLKTHSVSHFSAFLFISFAGLNYNKLQKYFFLPFAGMCTIIIEAFQMCVCVSSYFSVCAMKSNVFIYSVIFVSLECVCVASACACVIYAAPIERKQWKVVHIIIHVSSMCFVMSR